MKVIKVHEVKDTKSKEDESSKKKEIAHRSAFPLLS